MFTLPNVLYFLAHEFSGLSSGGFAFSFVLLGSFDRLLLWHFFLPKYENPPW
ncbi:MAG: hypothetical protein JOY54_04415 [Acidobacteriaceae bacterium]|nr:hypothetical protein [Acidobacteriaceae bacterium]